MAKESVYTYTVSILQNVLAKIKAVSRDDWMVVLIIVLVAILSFGLGRLSVSYGEGKLEIVYPSQEGASAVTSLKGKEQSVQKSSLEAQPLLSGEGQYVASKNGSKYHFPWCPGARSIKEENKIYFSTKEEAEARGYAPAVNCKGL